MIAAHPAPVLENYPEVVGKFFVANDPYNAGDHNVRYLGRDGVWYELMGTGSGHYFDTEEEAQAAMDKALGVDHAEIKSHAEAAQRFRDNFGPNAQVSYERLVSIVGNDWAGKMRFAGTVVWMGNNVFELGQLHK